MVLPEITFALVIGVLTVVFGILVKLIGFPDQFRLNYKRKSTYGVSTLFIVLSLIAYMFWTIHGLLRSDWVLILGQGLGIITTGLIIAQIIIYKKKSK